MPETKIVGILNVTPDSFSDGGKNFTAEAALQAIAQYIADGADVIDIGAESTRPGATPLSPKEEWQRLAPVLASLPKHPTVQFSIDTRHAETTKKALAAGAHWINDVSGFSDPAMVAAVKDSSCKLVVMHSLTVPTDKNVVMPENVNVIEALLAFARERLGALEAAGIPRARIIFDPGIGFGKTVEQSLSILHRIAELKVLDVPLLVGHSRKSFLSEFGKNRDAATLAVSQSLAEAGVDYLRVHDVAQHRRLLNFMKAAV